MPKQNWEADQKNKESQHKNYWPTVSKACDGPENKINCTGGVYWNTVTVRKTCKSAKKLTERVVFHLLKPGKTVFSFPLNITFRLLLAERLPTISWKISSNFSDLKLDTANGG